MLYVLDVVGIPLDSVSDRTKMRIAEAVLAVAGIKKSFAEAKSSDDKHFLTTRQVITFENDYLEGKYSPGSYDDIRRSHLILLTTAGYIVSSSSLDTQSTNNPTRGYAASPAFAELLRSYFGAGAADRVQPRFFDPGPEEFGRVPAGLEGTVRRRGIPEGTRRDLAFPARKSAQTFSRRPGEDHARDPGGRPCLSSGIRNASRSRFRPA